MKAMHIDPALLFKRHAAALCVLFAMLLAASVLLSGCSSNEAPADKVENAVYVYMCGSTLETKGGAASDSLNELMDATMDNDTRVIVQTGGARKWRGSHGVPSDAIARYEVKDGALVELNRLPDASMGDAATLSDFLRFCARQAPAEHTALVFWDHGGGSVTGVCFDENHGMDSLSLPELTGALKDAGTSCDIIGFDACLMATLETIHAVSPYARHFIASEELEPTEGWDYAPLLAGWNDPAKACQEILDAYAARCDEAGKGSYTLSHVDLEDMASVDAAFDAFLTNTLEPLAITDLQSVSDAAMDAMGFGVESKADLVDLAHFASNLGDSQLAAAITDNVASVCGAERIGAKGISIFYPLSSLSQAREYAAVSPLGEYRALLSRLHGEAPNEELLVVTRPGTITPGKELSFAISPESVPFVRDAYYAVYRMLDDDEAQCLGIDRVGEDGYGGYTTAFKGLWMTVDGHLANCEPLDSVGDITTFAVMCRLNGEDGFLRVTYDSSTRGFDCQGFVPYDGDDLAGRLVDVEAGDMLELLGATLAYEMTDPEYDVSAAFTVGNELDFEVAPVPDGTYELFIGVIDLYDGFVFSDTLVMEIEDGAVVSEELCDTEE